MKTVIICFRKSTGNTEAYTSLIGFCEHNPEYDADMLYSITSRKKKPYEDDEIILTRCPILGRIKSKAV